MLEEIKNQLILDLQKGQGFAVLSEIKRGRNIYRKNHKALEVVLKNLKDSGVIRTRTFSRKEFLILDRKLR